MSRLQVSEDLALQRRTWRFERIGWTVLGLLIVAAALGLFGDGWLANRRATAPDGSFWAEYQRFTRVHSPEQLRVHLTGVDAPDGRLRVGLDAAYLERVTVNVVTPEPESVELGAGRVTFLFAVSGVADAATLDFEVEGRRAGPAHGVLTVGEAAVRVDQFFFP